MARVVQACGRRLQLGLMASRYAPVLRSPAPFMQSVRWMSDKTEDEDAEAAAAKKKEEEATALAVREAEAYLQQFRTQSRPIKAWRDRAGPYSRKFDWLAFQGKNPSTFTLEEVRKMAPAQGELYDYMKSRRVRIERAPMPAEQTPREIDATWVLKFNHEDEWNMNLMGWVGSGDIMSMVEMKMRFDNAAQAVQFCERQGWDYNVVDHGEAGIATIPQTSYDEVVFPKDVRNEMKRRGPRKSRALFANPKAGTSGWINLKRSDYGKEKWKPRTD